MKYFFINDGAMEAIFVVLMGVMLVRANSDGVGDMYIRVSQRLSNCGPPFLPGERQWCREGSDGVSILF